MAGISKWWTLTGQLFILIGWSVLGAAYISVPGGLRAQLPPTWPVGLVQLIMAATNLALLLKAPSFYTQHPVSINACVMVLVLLTFPDSHAALLWKMSLERPSGIEPTVRFLPSFASENAYLSLMWLSVLMGDVGKIFGLAITTLWLFLALASNKFICGLPYTGHKLVSMSPQILKVVWPIAQFVQSVGDAYAGAISGPPGLSYDPRASQACPVVLGIWQVLGWCIACHVIFGVDILRRRAFLRTAAAMQININ